MSEMSLERLKKMWKIDAGSSLLKKIKKKLEGKSQMGKDVIFESVFNKLYEISEVEKDLGIEFQGSRLVIFEALDRVAEKDEDFSYNLFWRANYVLKDVNKTKDITADDFLIASIRNTIDAQTIGPLISKENLGMYNEKVANFY